MSSPYAEEQKAARIRTQNIVEALRIELDDRKYDLEEAQGQYNVTLMDLETAELELQEMDAECQV